MLEGSFNNLEGKPEVEKVPDLSSLQFVPKANFLTVSFILDGKKYELSIEILEEEKRQGRNFWEIFLNFLKVEKNIEVEKDTSISELPTILKQLAEEIEQSKENVKR